jgi:hypothetical protein
VICSPTCAVTSRRRSGITQRGSACAAVICAKSRRSPSCASASSPPCSSGSRAVEPATSGSRRAARARQLRGRRRGLHPHGGARRRAEDAPALAAAGPAERPNRAWPRLVCLGAREVVVGISQPT